MSQLDSLHLVIKSDFVHHLLGRPFLAPRMALKLVLGVSPDHPAVPPVDRAARVTVIFGYWKATASCAFRLSDLASFATSLREVIGGRAVSARLVDADQMVVSLEVRPLPGADGFCSLAGKWHLPLQWPDGPEWVPVFPELGRGPMQVLFQNLWVSHKKIERLADKLEQYVRSARAIGSA